MRATRHLRGTIGVLAVASLAFAACGDDSDDDTEADASDATEADDMTDTEAGTPEATEPDDMTDADEEALDSAQACDADAIVDAVENGPDDGTLAGMTDDPVGTAASNNPVLTTLTTAVTEAGLVDTLNSADALTVFAPTDCAFAGLDPEVLDAALADPEGLLTDVLGFHVVAGEELVATDLEDGTELETFGGATLDIAVDGDEVTVGDQATVVVPDIETANATVHLIDTVMLPPEG